MCLESLGVVGDLIKLVWAFMTLMGGDKALAKVNADRVAKKMPALTGGVVKIVLVWMLCGIVLRIVYIVLLVRMYRGLKANSHECVKENLKKQVYWIVGSMVLVSIFMALLKMWIGIVAGWLITAVWLGIFVWYVNKWCYQTKCLEAAGVSLPGGFGCKKASQKPC